MEKAQLREKIKSQRLAMSLKDVSDKSRIIMQKLISSTDWTAVKSVYIYETIAALNECDTGELISYLKARQPQIRTTIAGKSAKQLAPEQQFDLIIVPTLAFDKELNRLGWGGGWYDKFLAAQPQAKKIGLCFENGRVDKIPAKPYDIRLDKIITEEGIMG